MLEWKPRFLSVEGFRDRTLVTRFGEVVVRRTIYSDGSGNMTFALDDHLGWNPRRQASPLLMERMGVDGVYGAPRIKCGAGSFRWRTRW